MTPEDIALLPYLINNFDTMELAPKYNDKMGNRAIEVRKRINGTTVIATIEKGKSSEHVVTGWKFKKSDALDAHGAPGLYVQNDSDLTKVQQDIEYIKSMRRIVPKWWMRMENQKLYTIKHVLNFPSLISIEVGPAQVEQTLLHLTEYSPKIHLRKCR